MIDLSNKYGETMSIADLSEVMHMEKSSIHNAISSRRFPIPTFLGAGKKRLALTSDVESFINGQRQAQK